MRVSVLMSVFNGERFVREAVLSILNQTFADFELLIVDDASTDATVGILHDLAQQDNRIHVLTNTTNLGLTKSLNIALRSAFSPSNEASADRQAQGALIARMDADDIALPSRLEKQVAFLTKHPDIGMIGTAYQYIDATGNVVGEKHPPTTNEILHHSLIRFNPFLHSSVIVRKTLLDRVQGYNETFRRAQDYDLWMRLAPLTLFANLPEMLMQKRFTTTMISYSREHHKSDPPCASAPRLSAINNIIGRGVPPQTPSCDSLPFLGASRRIYIFEQQMYTISSES